jgi:hypothetical protein
MSARDKAIACETLHTESMARRIALTPVVDAVGRSCARFVACASALLLLSQCSQSTGYDDYGAPTAGSGYAGEGTTPGNGGSSSATGGSSGSGSGVGGTGGASDGAGGSAGVSTGGTGGTGGASTGGSPTVVVGQKPRVIVTTDGEGDDLASFVRFLFYANEMDVEALVYVSSKFHPHGEGTQWMQTYIDQYGKVYDNLRQHDPAYPSPTHLKGLISIGNLSDQGTAAIGAGKDTAGSTAIQRSIEKNDQRFLWLQAWGGTNTIAQAFYQVRRDNPSTYGTLLGKVGIYVIYEQEESHIDSLKWIRSEFPNMLVMKTMEMFGYFAYPGWLRKVPSYLNYLYEKPWWSTHIKQSHGALGASYLWDDLFSEGDSLAYFHNMATGLGSMEDPGFGGWGGRFRRVSNNYWEDAADDGDIQKSGWRWFEALQWDLAARADWCVQPKQNANHHPVVVVDGPLDRTARPGDVVKLSAAGSSDPDGHTLSFKWWQYYDADTATQKVSISNDTSRDNASFTVPNEPGKTVHIILEVKDDGTPALVRYARIVVTIAN